MSVTKPAKIGMGGASRRPRAMTAIARGTSTIRIAKSPATILAVNIRLLVTGNTDKNAEILLFRSMYICVTPIAENPKTSITSIGIERAPKTADSLDSKWYVAAIRSAMRIAEKTTAAMK